MNYFEITPACVASAFAYLLIDDGFETIESAVTLQGTILLLCSNSGHYFVFERCAAHRSNDCDTHFRKGVRHAGDRDTELEAINCYYATLKARDDETSDLYRENLATIAESLGPWC